MGKTEIPMKTVLIPTDFSTNALQALKYAQELFKCERACFFVLHAYAEQVYGMYGTFRNVGCMVATLKETGQLENTMLGGASSVDQHFYSK